MPFGVPRTWKNHNRTEHSPEAVGLAGFVQRSEAERSSALEKELCAKLCFVGYERCKFSNFLRVALLQHVFTELMPLPLGPLAEKPPLNLTDPAAWTVREGEDEVGRWGGAVVGRWVGHISPACMRHDLGLHLLWL